MKTENLRLITPCEEYLNSYIEAYNEDVNFRAGMDECLCPPETVIETACKYRNGIDIPPERVPSSMLWLVTDNKFIGCTDIRHYLADRLFLSDWHIGYEVRFRKLRDMEQNYWHCLCNMQKKIFILTRYWSLAMKIILPRQG